MSELQQLQQFNARLAECQAERRETSTLSAKLGEVERQLNVSRRSLHDANVILHRESCDVESLEGYTLTALFYTILGTHEERLIKERQERLAAKLRHDEAEETVASLETQVVELSRQLDAMGDVDQRYQAILSDKAVYLYRSNNPSVPKLIEIAEALTDLALQEKELLEAVRAGNQADRTLGAVQNCLSSASNWGTADLIGGGMLTTMIKHSRMDNARHYAHQAQRELLRFQQELADANERLHVSLNIDGFSKFADYFFDGMIADWIVQSKIANANRQCANMICAVRLALRKCRHRLTDIRSEREQNEEERGRIIEVA